MESNYRSWRIGKYIGSLGMLVRYVSNDYLRQSLHATEAR